MKLTETQQRALRLTQRGRQTFIIDMEVMQLQPIDLQMAASELPRLVSLGLFHKEEISATKALYRITEAGRTALSNGAL